MAAARWQKCVYVHKSRIFADIPHPLCVSLCAVCARFYEYFLRARERNSCSMKRLELFKYFYGPSSPLHSLSPSLWALGPLSDSNDWCVCVSCFGLDVKKELCTHRNNGLKERVQSEHSHFTHTHIWSVPAFWWMTFYRTQNLCSYFRSGTKDMQAFASYWLAAIDDSNYIMHTQAVSVIFTFGHCPFFPFATKTEPLALFLFRSFTFRISVCLFAHQQLECIPKIA